MPIIGERIKDQPVAPHLVEVMRLAFRKACDVLQLEHDPDDPMADLVASEIIELAKAGETDPDRLCSQALIGVSEQLGMAGLPAAPTN
jgi:hypothetical protein